jgi:hypothetical protein
MSTDGTHVEKARPAAQAQSVVVTQALGIRDTDGFRVDGLSPGLNIIIAPNATGKTTLCRVLMCLAFSGERSAWRALLGQSTVADREFGRLACSAEFSINLPGTMRQWHVELIGGSVTETVDGSQADIPARDATLCSRYSLALPDLLADDGSDFGRRISEQLSGGIRWGVLRDELAWAKEPGIARACREKVRQAKARVDELRNAQADIATSFAKLAELELERRAIDDRIARENGLRAMRHLRNCMHNESQCRADLDAIDGPGALLTHSDFEDAKRLHEAVREADQALKAHDQELAKHEIQAPAVPTAAEQSLEFPPLFALVKKIRQLEADYREADELLRTAVSERKSAESNLVDLRDSRAAGGMTPGPDPRKVFDAGSDVARAQWDLDAVQRLDASLGDAVERISPGQASGAAQVPGSDDVLAAMRIASQWLRRPARTEAPLSSERPAPRWLWVWLGLAILSVVVAIAAAARWQGLAWLSALLALAIGGGILATMVRMRRSAATSPMTAIDDHDRREFEALALRADGLPKPTSWSIEDVLALHLRLSALYQDSLLRSVAQDLVRSRERLRLVDLTQARDDAVERLAQLVGPRNSDFHLIWEGTLSRLLSEWLTRLSEERSASEARLFAESALRSARTELFLKLAGIGAMQATAADDLAADLAEEVLQEVKSRIERHERHKTRRAELVLLGSGSRGQLESAKKAERELYGRLPSGINDLVQLQRLRKDFERAETLHGEFRKAVAMREAAEVQAAPWPDLHDMSMEELDLELGALKDLRARSEELSSEIAEIKEGAKTAGAGTALANAERDHAASHDALRLRETEDLETIIGIELFEWARREATSKLAPRVLARAREYVTQFTAGRLQLSIEEGDAGEPRFLSRNGAESWRSVDALSSGERIQLLMSVRLAFLDESESIRLPLILDEVLATADDARSAHIMDAVLEIVRSGRQVFYLTSQADEQEKWRRRAEASGLPMREHDLGAIRRKARADGLPRPTPTPLPAPVLAPDGLTRDEYADRIGVPGIDWRDPELGQLHLWHVIEDMGMLHRMLRAGIDTVSQLDRLCESRNAEELRQVRTQLQCRLSGLRAAARGWSIGRGLPVPASVLSECLAITASFRDRVAECLRQHGGDAHAFLQAVSDLPRFREPSARELEAWLADQKCLDERPRISRMEIETQVRAALIADGCPLDRCGEETQRIMAQLPKP